MEWGERGKISDLLAGFRLSYLHQLITKNAAFLSTRSCHITDLLLFPLHIFSASALTFHQMILVSYPKSWSSDPFTFYIVDSYVEHVMTLQHHKLLWCKSSCPSVWLYFTYKFPVFSSWNTARSMPKESHFLECLCSLLFSYYLECPYYGTSENHWIF